MGPGVRHPADAAARFTLTRHAPPGDLAPFLDFCWLVRWDLRGQPAHEQAVLPHPNVHLAFEPDRTPIYGVSTKLFLRKIEGLGATLGVRFWPGGFRPLWSEPIARLTDRVVAADGLLGRANGQAALAEQVRRAVNGEPDDAVVVGRSEALLE